MATRSGVSALDIRRLLEQQSLETPDAPALLAPGRAGMTYAGLADQIHTAAAALNAIGIGRGDRVATALSNGPEAATAFLSIAAAAACAPLNPAYREAEFKFYLSDLGPKAIVVERGVTSPAITAAESLGIPVLQLCASLDQPAGAFHFEHELPAAVGSRTGAPSAQDVALVLHTSGTTSRPKQVPLTNANLCYSAAHIRRALELTSADRCLNVMPLFHIHGLVAAVLASLASGASVVCTPGFYAPQFLDWLTEFEPTWYTAVPTIHQSVLVRAKGEPRKTSLRFIRSCSAPLPPRVMEELERTFSVPVIESYGMTEAAHQMASNPLPPGSRKPGSVGIAAGPDIAIMDDAGLLLPQGATGEIVIRGPNVIAAYVANPEANRTAFTDGWFRTGDLGRFDDEGYLFIIGRTKEIINRGGEKVSPREIDEALLQHPDVAQALAFAVPDDRLGEEPAAAVVLKPGAAAGESELREFASERLADFKVPRLIVQLDDIPKGPTGKPQRIGLAARLGIDSLRQPARQTATQIAPRTPSEELIAGLWRHVLGHDHIGVRDSFFDLGGDSILAGQLLSRLAQTAGTAPPVLRLFENPTVEALAAWLDANSSTSGEPALEHDSTAPPSMSFAQQRFWFLDQYEADSAAYINCFPVRLMGTLDDERLRRAIERVVERHEVLRTHYRADGGVPTAVVGPPRVDMRIATASSVEEAAGLAAAEARRRFDLARDLMIRATLVRLAPDDHVLLLTKHHIAFDGWSTETLVRELAAGYENTPLDELPVQYSDYARWQQDRYAAGAFDSDIAYWRERLAGSPPLLPLPLDGRRPPRQTFRGACERLTLPSGIAGTLNELARSERATLFMALLAAFKALLHRYSGATDITVGCPIAGRSRVELEPLIGLFVNTLALRTDVSGDPSFRELLARVRDTALGAYGHQELPFEKLVEALQPERSLSHSPLFNVMFQLFNLPFEAPRFAGIASEPFDFDPGSAQFDLTMAIMPAGGALRCTLTYNTDLFERDTARRMVAHYRNLLAGATAEPELPVAAIPILGEEERRQLLAGWNQTEKPLNKRCVHERIADQAMATPAAVAVVDAGGELSYSEMNRAADDLAARLRMLGAGPGELVGICLERSRAIAVALLGILKTGSAYVPLDPQYPKERLAFMLEDSRARILVTERRVSGCLPERVPAIVFLDDAASEPPGECEPQPAPGPESPAYAIYTSGSTGVPKAVLVPHRGLANVLESLRSELGFGPQDKWLAVSTLSFDIAAVEFLLPLMCGGTVAVASREQQTDGRALREALERLRPTYMQATPATWGMLIDAGWSGSNVLTATCGGEAMTRSLADSLLARAGRVYNLYGPTETAVYSTLEKVESGTEAVPIGRPIANTRVYVLDDRLEPVPQGVTGELYIAGAGVALGYLNRPELTAERFPEDPFASAPGARMYKTGDLVRWLPGGRLAYLGRRDAQIKVRGFRVEPGEVEAALAAHPDIRAAAVTVRGDALVAWCVWREQAPDSAAVREYLADRLPHYMIPGRFIARDSLPILPSGKVDRRTLAESVEPPTTDAAAGPSNETERKLARIWEELIGAGPVGIRDNFFDLGGHSLLAARVAARIEKEFGRRLPVATLFEAPTIAQLAARVIADVPSAWPPRVIPIQPAGTRPPFWAIGAGLNFRTIAEHLGPDQPVLGVLLEDADVPKLGPPYCVETIAAEIVRTIRSQQPDGPYHLGGHSMQGLIAFETARRLAAEGEDVRLLALFDPYLPTPVRLRFPIALRLRVHAAAAWWLIARGRIHDACSFVVRTAKGLSAGADRNPAEQNTPPESIRKVLRLATDAYDPQPYAGRAVFLEASDQQIALHLGSCLGWHRLVEGGLDMRVVPGDHSSLLEHPNAAGTAKVLAELLSRDDLNS